MIQQVKKKPVKEVDEIHHVQNSSISVLENIIKLNETTIAVGIDTANQMKQQTSKMNQIQGSLNRLGNRL